MLAALVETISGSRNAATSKMEHFVIIVNGSKTLTIITKSSILDAAAVQDPPLADIFRTLSNIFDEAFLQKMAFTLAVFQRFLGKGVLKMAANLQKDTHAKV